ncbi:hypothetical protein INR49_018548 [Caranx melampygus]|nr:hypothetical protein INR49_018548 [Caranx melampygus]
MGDSMAEGTRVIYHLEDQETPYLIRINVPAERVTLADFKQVLNKPNVKFFFKSMDDDFGQAPPRTERTGGIGDSRPPSFHAAAVSCHDEPQGSEVSSPSERDASERGECLNGHAHQPADQNGVRPTSAGEPVRPIDPAAWVSHTAAMTGRLLPHYGVHEENRLTIHSDITDVVKAMANPESGLEVRDRMWLKITIPNAFIARKYAGNLLKARYIRHTVNKVTFSEQCYYVFGDLCGELGVMSLLDHEGDSNRGGAGSDSEPLALASSAQWSQAFPYQYPVPHPYSSPRPLQQLPAWVGGGGGSQHSEGSHSSGSNCSDGLKEGGGSQSDPAKRPVTESPGDNSAQQPPTSISGLQGNSDSKDPALPHSPSPGQQGDISSVPPEISASRQSFHLAMGNPSDFFVDVM